MADTKTFSGVLSNIQIETSKDDRKYRKFKVGNTGCTCFEGGLFKLFEEYDGKYVQVECPEGKYNNVTKIELSSQPERATWKEKSPDAQHSIEHQTALKAAVEYAGLSVAVGKGLPSVAEVRLICQQFIAELSGIPISEPQPVADKTEDGKAKSEPAEDEPSEGAKFYQWRTERDLNPERICSMLGVKSIQEWREAGKTLQDARQVIEDLLAKEGK